MTLRIAFMGTPDFAVPILEALAASPYELVRVYCQPPRPAGRGHREQPSPVQRRAAELGIEQRYPVSLKEPAIQAEFHTLDLDLAVVAAYGLILPPAILAAPRLGCLNVHASLLPRWRGAAPIHRAILAGDSETGITIMQMDAGLDTGAMLLQESRPIGPQTTASSLHDDLAALGARLILDAVAGVASGSLPARPQPEEGITYAAKLRREEAGLDWRLPAAQLERAIRALNPWPGTWFDYQGERIKVSAAEIAPLPVPAPPGTILDDRFGIACGDGFLLRPLRLQRPGRQALDLAAFLRGCPATPGLTLPSPDPCPATS